ncbi:S9 family peptidase [Chitinophaga sp. Cy-1792]|nr:S9 family peptidase [Chitinophaga sp. Cy-1792]
MQDTTIDNYGGTPVADPYRWLEYDAAINTRNWISLQRTKTQHYLDAIPFRKALTEQLSATWNFSRETPPVKVGNYYFFTRNNGLQPQNVWYLRKGLQGQAEELLDPNKLSDDGTAAVTMLGFSGNNRYLAYAVASAGSDWNTIRIMDIATRRTLPDEMKWVKFPKAAWKGNGFYYSRYPAPAPDHALTARNTLNQVYFHKLRTAQENDSLIYEAPMSVAAFVTSDERFLIISSLPGSFLGYKMTSSTGNALHYQDLSLPHGHLLPLLSGYEHHHIIVDNVGEKLLLQTDEDAPNNKLVLLDPVHPEKTHWQTMIPEQSSSLENIDAGGGYLWVSYLKDASSLVCQYDYSGKKVRDIQLPGIGTARNFSASKGDKDIFYIYTDFTTPETVYRLNIQDGTSVVYRKPGYKGATSGYETKQVFVPSKDGTPIPLFIVYKKGLRLDGCNPVFMQGHGGFKRNLTPFFHVPRMLFLERGGIYAQPNLRGGNEYGEAWHQGGMKGNRQNAVDDFIAVTEYLIREKYTRPSLIAITGVSTGAVMIGAAINQHPDLFRAAIPVAGCMDMLRYHKFTIGNTWAEEYGTSDNKEQFAYLIRYSPLHNITTGKSYPAVMALTGDHDDTVVPAHSYKYIATLQQKQGGNNPVLIRIDSNSGHGPGKPTQKVIAEAADAWCFIFQELGVSW